MKPINIGQMNRFTALIIGPAGIGKTSLIRTIPEDEKVFVLTAEGGLLVVRDLILAGKVDGAEINSIDDLKDAFASLQAPEFTQEYKWIFIDSLTEIADRCAEHLKDRFDKKDTYAMWGEYQASMTKVIKMFRDMQHYNVIFTCLPERDEDELKRKYYAPLMPGQALKSRLISYFDYVFYMREFTDEKGSFRAFQTVSSEQYPAKARLWYEGQLNPTERPDLGYIYQRLMGDQNGAN